MRSANPVSLWCLCAALLLAGCGGGGDPTLRDVDTSNVATGKATRDSFRVTILESGVLQARDQRTYLAPFSGRVTSLAEDGKEVQPGDVVAVLDTQKLRDDLESQINDLRLSKADLEKDIENMRAELRKGTLDAEKAEAGLEYDRARLLEVNRQLETLEALAGLDIVAEQEVDEKRTQFDGTRLNVIQSDLGFQIEDHTRDGLQEIRRQQLKDLGFKSERSMQRIDDGRERLNSATIRAQHAGTWVVSKRWQWSERRYVPVLVGDELNEGDALGDVGIETSPMIVSQVSEAQVSFAKPGTLVIMTSPALENARFEGHVVSVGNAAIDREQSVVGEEAQLPDPSGLKVFELKIEPSGEVPKDAKPGMTVDVAIVKKELPDVISVPLTAIFREEGLPVVFVKRSAGPEAVRVRLGDRNRERVVVEEGLEGGETVYLADLNERLAELKAKSGRGNGAAAVN